MGRSVTLFSDARLKLVAHNPENGIYRATDDYIHAVEAVGTRRQLFVSGTMGLDPSGHPANGIDAQLDIIWRNIARILRAANMTEDNIVHVRSFLTDRSHADSNARYRMQALRERPVAVTSVIVSTLDPKWLVEIEVTALD